MKKFLSLSSAPFRMVLAFMIASFGLLPIDAMASDINTAVSALPISGQEIAGITVVMIIAVIAVIKVIRMRREHFAS